MPTEALISSYGQTNNLTCNKNPSQKSGLESTIIL